MGSIRAVCELVHGSSVLVWEDDPGRSPEQVLHLIDCAISMHEQKLEHSIAALSKSQGTRSRTMRDNTQRFRQQCLASYPGFEVRRAA